MKNTRNRNAVVLLLLLTSSLSHERRLVSLRRSKRNDTPIPRRVLPEIGIERQSTTCTLNGVTYQAGENLEDAFQTRCGPTVDWPCYCFPGQDPPVQCPYCSMADLNQGLVCARDGEVVSIVNLNGIEQDCSCVVSSDGSALENCSEEPIDENGNNEENDDFCSIQVVDGSVMRFENGESLGGFRPTRCGDEYPCFCDTSKGDQVDCPYCTWLDYRNDLICARQSESVVYERAPGVFLECACPSDFISTCKAIAPFISPVEMPAPTTQPLSPSAPSSPIPSSTLMPTTSATITPTNDPPFTTTPTNPPLDRIDTPTFLPTNGITTLPSSTSPTSYFNGPSFIQSEKDSLLDEDRPPIPEPELGGCLFLNDTSGMVDLVEEGATFGPNVRGPCSPTEDWPVICNPSISNGGMEYPYCVFAATNPADDTEKASSRSYAPESVAVVCARTEERVTLTLEDGTMRECSCLYFNPLLGPSSSCPMVSVKLFSPLSKIPEGSLSNDDDTFLTPQAPPSSDPEKPGFEDGVSNSDKYPSSASYSVPEFVCIISAITLITFLLIFYI